MLLCYSVQRTFLLTNAKKCLKFSTSFETHILGTEGKERKIREIGCKRDDPKFNFRVSKIFGKH